MSNGRKSRSEVLPEVVFLGKLVERIADGKIRVPRFQRAYVWKQADLHALLDSVLRGFPIGSILIWDTDDDIETTEKVGPIVIKPRPNGVVGYLLDGQQRVATLLGTLRLPDDVAHIAHDVDWRVYCDLDKREFVRAPTGGLGPQHFPVRSLLTRISDLAMVLYRQDKSPRLDFWGSDVRSHTTEGDTLWVNYKPRPFSSPSMAF